MITLLCKREIRVQSRKPNGQFGTGGGGGKSSGGGGSKPSPKKGKLQTKPAPKSVTKGHGSKGEYIESKKTGGVYKNPNWDGKDAGTVALQGTTKLSPVGSFPKAGAPVAKPVSQTVTKKVAQPTASDMSTKIKDTSKVDSIQGDQKAVDKTTKLQEQQDKQSSKELHDKIDNPKGKRLSQNDENLIENYTGTQASVLNASIRENAHRTSPDPDYKDYYSKDEKKLNSALAGRTLDRDVAVTRGIDQTTKTLKVGDEMYDPAFQSFSTRSNAVMEGQTVMQVTLPAGTKGTSARSISNVKWEDEVLLPAGATYKVVAIERGFFSMAGRAEGSVRGDRPYATSRITVELVRQGKRKSKKMSGIRYQIPEIEQGVVNEQ